MNDSQAPLVSVVLPAYNVRSLIAEAIASVRAQAIDNIEIIVVDDGSSDGTADFVAAEFPEVRLFRKANGGAATARNLGMRESRGEYVAFLDADDVWLPGKLRAQIDYMAGNQHVRMVCGGFSFWLADDNGRFPDPGATYPPITESIAEADQSGWVYHKLLLSNFVWTSTVVMRRSLIDEIGVYDESLRLGQDYDYWLRASRVTEIHRLVGVMALYRKHNNSATMRGFSQTNHAAKVLETALAKWGRIGPDGSVVSESEIRERLYRIYFSAGYGCYKNRRLERAVREFKRSIGVRPFEPRAWFYLLAAISALAKARLTSS